MTKQQERERIFRFICKWLPRPQGKELVGQLRRLIAVLAAAVLLSVSPVKAQGMIYDSVPTNFVNVNSGDPGWATFYFGHPVNGEPGTTALIIQCGFKRAELITNFDAQGQQQSQFFGVICTETAGVQNFERTLTFALNNTPLYQSLVMQGFNGSISYLTLKINSATWTVTNPGRAQKSSGSAQIVY